MNSLAIIALRWVPAILLLQTLFYKFSAHPTSVHIFTTLGVEPWGRLTVGVIELIAGVCLFIPKLSVYGALIATLLMIGTIISHIFFIGFSVLGDGGRLFSLAFAVLIPCLLVLYQSRQAFITYVDED
jgi:uncharacterized membrane protein YphA (DoxX/SURF4 family)